MKWTGKNSSGLSQSFCIPSHSHHTLPYRLKKVQGKKKRDTAIRDAEKQAQIDKETTEVQQTQSGANESSTDETATDLLSGKDEDIIF
jgi:V-type H+-transporting ATPase subunit D